MAGLSTRAIFVWLVCTGAATLVPFDFAPPAPGGGHEFSGFSARSHQHDPVHFGLNLLMFVPFGALVHYGRQRRGANLFTIVITVGIAALLISFGVEWLQHLLPGRDSSLVDITANTAGALVGVFASQTFGAGIAGWINTLRASASPTALTVALASVMVVSLAASGGLQARSRLSNWSTEYPLLIGNEPTGDRPWRGTVFSLEITDAATQLSLVRRFAIGDSVLLQGTSVARFDFAGSGPYRDATGSGLDLDWTAPPADADEGGGAMTGQSWLQTRVAPSYLLRRLRETNAFTIRITCATNDPAQAGPARIVSNSVSPALRNFTVGQQGADLAVRVRTPLTGLNATRAETVVPEVFTDGKPRDILITYDGTSVVAAVAPSNQIVRTDLSPGLNAALTLRPRIVRLTQQSLYKLGYLAVLFLPPAVVIDLLGRSRRDRVMFSIAYLFTAASAIEGVLMLASGRAFDLVNACVTAAAGAVVLTLYGLTSSAPDLRPSLDHRGPSPSHARG
jgi:hypothetical protein